MIPDCAAVTVKQGTLNGIQSNLPNGEPYYSFKGIPYAIPPVGDLRFELPVPLEKFHTDPLDCFKEGNMCLQNNPFNGGLLEGSEDCLYLNIYTPSLKPNKLMPVMVYIHGGAFAHGNANSDYYLPLHLMEEHIVVVTITFRIGIFGFLYLPEGGIRGNFGLQDQLLAFKWINDNISKFGGDPENVTFFGVSAGAACIHLHILSSESKKYIHKAIMQGGNALCNWCLQNNSEGKPRKLAELMGCTAECDKEIGRFLKKQNSVELHEHFNHYLKNECMEEMYCLRPVVEKNIPNAFITRKPFDLTKDSESIDIPIMMGYSNREGLFCFKDYEAKIEEIDKNPLSLIKETLNLPDNDSRSLQIADKIRQFYFEGKRLVKEEAEGLIDILSDYYIIKDCHLLAEMHSRSQPDSPLYVYRFSFDGKLNFFKKNFPTIKGACHADDRFYIFQKSFDDGLLQPGTREELTVKRMCRMWSNFAKYGNPTPHKDEIIKWKWNPVKKIGDNDEFILDYLEIDDDVRMDKNPEKNRIDFWRDILHLKEISENCKLVY